MAGRKFHTKLRGKCAIPRCVLTNTQTNNLLLSSSRALCAPPSCRALRPAAEISFIVPKGGELRLQGANCSKRSTECSTVRVGFNSNFKPTGEGGGGAGRLYKAIRGGRRGALCQAGTRIASAIVKLKFLTSRRLLEINRPGNIEMN